jgi:hypothetical protein
VRHKGATNCTRPDAAPSRSRGGGAGLQSISNFGMIGIQISGSCGMAMMKLSNKYELLDLLHDGATKTYQARQIPSGRQVLVHLRPLAGAASPGNHDDTVAMLWRYLKATLPEGRSKLLDMGEYEEGVYVATETLSGFQSLDQWLRTQTAAFEDVTVMVRAPIAAPAASPSPESSQTIQLKSPPPPQASDIDFDRTIVKSVPPAEPVQPTVPQPAASETAAKTYTGATMATQISPALTDALTQARDAWLAQKHSGTSPAATPAEPPPESTMIFQPPERSQVAGKPVEAPRPTDLPAANTDSTMLFNSSLLTPAAPPAIGQQPASETPSRASSGSGEFTKVFQAPVGGGEEPMPEFPQPESASPSQAPPGEFTRIFQAPSKSREAPATPTPSEPPAAPGEFTRVFGSSIDSLLTSQPAAPVAPARSYSPPVSARLAPAQPKAGRSILPWVILTCVALAALAGFLYFFFLRR